MSWEHDQVNYLTRRVETLTEAFRLTVEYVGVELLRPEPGWDWYEALEDEPWFAEWLSAMTRHERFDEGVEEKAAHVEAPRLRIGSPVDLVADGVYRHQHDEDDCVLDILTDYYGKSIAIGTDMDTATVYYFSHNEADNDGRFWEFYYRGRKYEF